MARPQRQIIQLANSRELYLFEALSYRRRPWRNEYEAGGAGMATTKAQLNRYFGMIDRRVPIRVSQAIRWLRKPSSFGVRVVVALLLILGGIFSFLPILGVWMLPLGLLLIAQDVPLLQKPLVRSLAWVEAKWVWLKLKWRDKYGSIAPHH